MFKELEKNDTWQKVKKILKQNQIIKKAEIFELENIVAKLQNSLGMSNNRLDQAEEMMRHLKLHNQRKKRKKNEKRVKKAQGACGIL